MKTTQAQRRATDTYRKRFATKTLWEVLGLLLTLKPKK